MRQKEVQVDMEVLGGNKNRKDYTNYIIEFRNKIKSIDNDLYNLPIKNNDVSSIKEHLNDVINILDKYMKRT